MHRAHVVVLLMVVTTTGCRRGHETGNLPAPAGSAIAEQKAATGAVGVANKICGDEEAPSVQVTITNGVRVETPWKDVPEVQRFEVEYEPPRVLVSRIPIVEIRINARDKNGQPVPPVGERGKPRESEQPGVTA